MEERLVSVSEETTTGVKQMQESGTLLFHAINVTKSKVALMYTSCCCSSATVMCVMLQLHASTGAKGSVKQVPVGVLSSDLLVSYLLYT
ncbi:uncharacterized protein [Triticum aestivum]|uniref:uncharacterized protein isoform X2 n=1 Tax=Triticum aestivum TaxID=4565 RepID=UPI001D024198|nr:uncharacterized protein LOC123143235 isoform X2 [Triticum aestivum]XP_044418021.1 uncharacterized protein LOC123143235 isoform X2 [Triticum aestivum]